MTGSRDDRLQVGVSLLSLAPEQFTGTGTYVRELLGELARRDDVGLEVLCNTQTVDRVAHLRSDHVRVMRSDGFGIGSSRLTRVGSLAASLVRPGTAGRQLQAAAQVVHYPLTLPIPTVRRPTVVTLHDVQHHELPRNFTRVQRVWRKLTYDRAAQRADVVITDSQHAREQIVERLNIDEERVLAVHLAVDHDRFSPDRQAGEADLLAGLDLPERFLYYPASLWPHKNHRRLLAAFGRLQADDVQLLLSGATFGREPELAGWATEHGLDGRVRHLGFVADDAMPALYRRASGVVFPSLFEGFGCPPLEAMAAGCPVASSRRASLSEVCGDAAAELVPEDVNQMADAIERLLTDSTLRTRLRAAGLAHAAGFSWSDSAQAHLRAYEMALATSGSIVGRRRRLRPVIRTR